MSRAETNYVSQLTEKVRELLRDDFAGQYTALSARRGEDGSTTMTVKDKRHSGQLEIIVREKAQ